MKRTLKALTAPAPIDDHTAPPGDRQVQLEAVARAAILWVYDQQCSSALATLEDAVVAYTGRPID